MRKTSIAVALVLTLACTASEPSADAVYREGHARASRPAMCDAALPILSRAADMDRARSDALRDIATCKRIASDREGACAAAREIVARDQLRGASAAATLELCATTPTIAAVIPSVEPVAAPEAERTPESERTLPAGTRAEAEGLFRAAHAQFVEGNCDAAMPGLIKAASIDGTYGDPLRDIAMCHKASASPERACTAAKELVKRQQMSGVTATNTLGLFCGQRP